MDTNNRIIYEYLDYLSECAVFIGNSYNEIVRLSKKYDLYLVSNGEPSVQYPRIKASGLDKIFKGLFISSEIGHQKPKKEFFDYIEKHIEGFNKEAAIVIGDSLTSDIKGAIDANISTCWFNPKGFKSHLNIDYIISSLDELK